MNDPLLNLNSLIKKEADEILEEKGSVQHFKFFWYTAYFRQILVTVQCPFSY